MAVSNISKNRKMYFPYILTSILTIMMFYMMSALFHNKSVAEMNGGEMVKMLLGMGMWVAGIFAVIFLFYTNSFLIKRRKKEIGLYNILGMEKRHIGKMMFFETLTTALASIVLGVVLGIVFSKLMFLLLIKLIGAETIPAFAVPVESVLFTIILFGSIFFATLIYNLAKIHLTKPIELLHGGEIGEKEPKTKILLTVIGLACMGGGYWFALTAESPLAAMNLFFLAVVLVIVGTYALFTAGSISLIKLLKRNKKFYYKAKHFTSISGMLYRMKQNAVGLANICILSTMVLISISTSVSLYTGMEDTANSQYPKEIVVSSHLDRLSDSKLVETQVRQLVQEAGTQAEDYSATVSVTAYAKSSSPSELILMGKGTNNAYLDKEIAAVAAVTLQDYNQLTGGNEQLAENEVLVYHKGGTLGETLALTGTGVQREYHIKRQMKEADKITGVEQMANMVDVYLVVLPDVKELEEFKEIAATVDESAYFSHSILFDTGLSKQESIQLSGQITKLEIPDILVYSNCRYEAIDAYHQLYGGILFIGIFVSVLFLMATVLVIYYKQISEGYEDRERFIIMQKVGMSHSEVKRSIRSQVMMIFFLPLAVAALHVLVSFRIIQIIVTMLVMGNTTLFTLCTIITLLIFCVIYGLVFVVTAKSYYRIVSSAES